MNIKIIRAEEKHVAAIGQLWWEFMLFHQNIDPVWTPLDNSIPDMEENHLRRFMKSEDGLVLVALDKGAAIGYSLSEIRRISPGLKREKYGYIDTLAITANYRRSGIGEKMYSEILQWFKLKNVNRVEIQTTAKNIMANSFWQKQGFTIFQHNLYREI
jgi:ribosomal protein S18 acetylase RimI-like enzyme